MTTHQDQPPLSRRALRQERSRAEEIDDSAEADRAPSGRRARAANPEGLIEVANAEQADAEQPAAEQSAAVEQPSDAPIAAESHAAESEPAPVLTDSAIPKAFPFADQVEATSDDAGHTGFRLRDFSPELSTARADSQSASDWTPANSDESVPLEYQTQGAPAFGYVSPYAEPLPAEPAAEPSFDSLFSDLLAPEAAAETPSDDQVEADSADDNASEAASAVAEPVIPVGEPVVVSEPVAPVAPVEVAPEERTLSRREWRAMRAAAEAAAAAEAPAEEAPVESDTDVSDAAAANAPVSDAPVSDVPVSDAPVDGPPADDAAAQVELLFQEPESAEPEQAQPHQAETEQLEQSQPQQDQPQQAATEQRPEAADIQPSATDAAFIPPLIEPVAAPQPALSEAMAEFEALTRSPQDAPEQPGNTGEQNAPAEPAAAAPSPAAPSPAAPNPASNAPFSFQLNPATAPATPANTAPAGDTDSASYTPPIGHWSRQAELDDENQPFENTLSRDVGGGNVATTTNALVLPMIPQRDDFSSVLNATGEIMVTGTINLPGSVGTTGRDSRHYDDPEVDHLFDAFDTEIANTDSAPVRAITAVSSHTATRGGIESGRKQSNRMLNVLLVTACVMAAAVAGLLVAGFVFKIF